MATRDYSDAQEAMISSYLGWDRVPASGGASFTCGDVISGRFLGECKTHEAPGGKVTFRQDAWDKLCRECISTGKIPVLFADDGSCRDYNTYCITRKPADMSMLPRGEFHMQDYKLNYKKHLNFDVLKLQKKMSRHGNSIFIIDWIEPVLLMGLATFDEYRKYI